MRDIVRCKGTFFQLAKLFSAKKCPTLPLLGKTSPRLLKDPFPCLPLSPSLSPKHSIQSKAFFLPHHVPILPYSLLLI